jgi:hypothetical protein
MAKDSERSQGLSPFGWDGVGWVGGARGNARWWRLCFGLALVGLGTGRLPAVAGPIPVAGAAPVDVAVPVTGADQSCMSFPNGRTAPATSVCCHGQALQGTLPGLSEVLSHDLCQLLVLPTASRSEGENFLSQVDPASVLHNSSASAEAMTLPSLWWARDSIPRQLGRHRLVDAWISYTIQDSGVRVVDVMVNSQFWRALTMPERYSVLNKFGTNAQEFGYHLRFFHNNGYAARMIGFYACEGTQEVSAALLGQTSASLGSCLASVSTPQIVQLQQAVIPNGDRDRSQYATQPAPQTARSVRGRMN